MGARRIRREQRAADMKESRLNNGFLKAKERTRRHDRIVNIIIKAGNFLTPPS